MQWRVLIEQNVKQKEFTRMSDHQLFQEKIRLSALMPIFSIKSGYINQDTFLHRAILCTP